MLALIFFLPPQERLPESPVNHFWGEVPDVIVNDEDTFGFNNVPRDEPVEQRVLLRHDDM